MNNYAIIRKKAWRDAADLERAASRSSRVGSEEMPDRVRWIRSYICEEEDGSLGSVCIYQAVDRDAVFEHARRADMACDAVLPIARTVVISDDPTT
jgi:hypothetical protein